jgi:hypothetical protein
MVVAPRRTLRAARPNSLGCFNRAAATSDQNMELFFRFPCNRAAVDDPTVTLSQQQLLGARHGEAVPPGAPGKRRRQPELDRQPAAICVQPLRCFRLISYSSRHSLLAQRSTMLALVASPLHGGGTDISRCNLMKLAFCWSRWCVAGLNVSVGSSGNGKAGGAGTYCSPNCITCDIPGGPTAPNPMWCGVENAPLNGSGAGLFFCDTETLADAVGVWIPCSSVTNTFRALFRAPRLRACATAAKPCVLA